MLNTRFHGKVALVTGGAGFIGLACAHRLAAEGAQVVLSDVRPNEEVVSPGLPYLWLSHDVRDPAAWQQALETVVQRFGTVDVLVNNAGMISQQPSPFDEIGLEEWRRVFAVNVDGALLGMQAAMRAMKYQPQGGAIVNMGSVSAFVGSKDLGTYASSKGALYTMSKQAAISAAHFGYKVRVNAVHPGYLWTPFVAEQLTQRYGGEEQAKQAVARMNPLGKIVEPADVAAAVAFLASDDARMITGADIVVDGGRLAQ